MVGRTSAADFERMVRGNILKDFPISVTNIKNSHKIFGPDVGSLCGKIIRKNRSSNVGLCANPRADKKQKENN